MASPTRPIFSFRRSMSFLCLTGGEIGRALSIDEELPGCLLVVVCFMDEVGDLALIAGMDVGSGGMEIGKTEQSDVLAGLDERALWLARLPEGFG